MIYSLILKFCVFLLMLDNRVNRLKIYRAFLRCLWLISSRLA